MQEPTTYVGASSRHVFCENYDFQSNVTLKMFKTDEIYSDFMWLDMRNCTGVLDEGTFKNLPTLEILNIRDCKFEEIEEATFSTVKNLKSIDVSKSRFPLSKNIFVKCENLESLRLIKLENEIKPNTTFSNIKNLEYLMFHHILQLELTNDMFLGLENLKYLFVTRCNIQNFEKDVFKLLKNLEVLYFTGNSLQNLTESAFEMLTGLKILGIYDNVTNPSGNMSIDYQTFENLPLLETISFPEEILKNIDFNHFKSLKIVQLVAGKSSDDILEFLKKKGLNVEWSVDTDLSIGPDFNDPNIQICS